MPIKILLADEYPIVCEGITRMAESNDMTLVGNVMACDDLVEAIEQRHPDVLVTEVRLAGHDVIRTLEEYSADETGCKVLFFSHSANPNNIGRASSVDCYDYLLKSSTMDELATAIRYAAAGKKTPESSLLKKSKGKIRDTSAWDKIDVPLTLRERQVLQHVAMGMSNKEVGRSLGISVETVKEHVQNILRKLDVNDRTQAAVWAVREGLI